MILELDIGNSRSKWRLLEPNEGAVVSAGIVRDFATLTSRELVGISPRRVRVACVRQRQLGERIRHWSLESWGVDPELAQVQRSLEGLTVFYEDCSRLGVDRWLAMLAAYREAQDAAIVIDCGTAVTVDFIEPDGHHGGGFIIPGLQLQQRALTDYTEIRLSDPGSEPGLAPGHSTDDAVRNGVLFTLVALLEKATQREREDGDTYHQVFLTGGDGLRVSRYLRLSGVTVHAVPALVLDGLAIALP
ncbi:MAG: Type pantothenate kinase [Pseudomonadota bacterium]|jgi:type III pantothenate kinase